jgi:outer membrane lipoprotein carrier protein
MRPTRRPAVVALVGLGVALAGATRPLAAQAPVDAILQHVHATYAHVTTTRATFQQVITSEMTGTSATSHGELIQEKPNLLAVTFVEPAGDRIVADGTFLWVYVPSATPGQVIKAPLGASGTAAIDFVQQFVDAPRDHFTVSGGAADTALGHKAHVLMLVPKDANSSIASAKVWVGDDDGVVRQFETVDGTGSTRHVRLTTVAFNVTVPRSTFAYTPPHGVKVIDRQAMSGGTGS